MLMLKMKNMFCYVNNEKYVKNEKINLNIVNNLLYIDE